MKLNIGTLNYSGILLSPYEFYGDFEDSLSLAKIGQQFLKLLEKEVKKLEWDFGKLDQEWQKERYCPLYNPTSGVRNTFMMNKFDF